MSCEAKEAVILRLNIKTRALCCIVLTCSTQQGESVGDMHCHWEKSFGPRVVTCVESAEEMTQHQKYIDYCSVLCSAHQSGASYIIQNIICVMCGYYPIFLKIRSMIRPAQHQKSVSVLSDFLTYCIHFTWI